MKKELKNILAVSTLAVLAACGGGSGGSGSGGNGGTGPGTGERPATESIADLANFASGGNVKVSPRGLSTAYNEYTKDGVRTGVTLQGDTDVGLLSVRSGNDPLESHTLIGSSADKTVNHRGYYMGDASGALRMRSGEDVRAVSGTAAISMSSTSGEWEFGTDLWADDNTSGVYVGIGNGRVSGNTMVFDAAESSVVELSSEGVIRSSERAGATAVFNDSGTQAFGTVRGNNNGTGFMLDAGFSGVQYEE